MQQISLSTQLDNYGRDNMGYCTDYVLTIDYVEEENGKKELAFVPEIILKQLSKTIDDMDIFLVDNKYELRNEVSTISDYYKSTNQDYIVNCKII